ncbi:Ig-like domain-containing protein [Mycobacterium sp. MMS18-G62]
MSTAVATATPAEDLAVPSSTTLTPVGVVRSFIDLISTWLSSLPANPITDLLQGAWLFLRRTVFDEAPTLNPVQATGQSSGPITGDIGAVDPEGDPIKYRVVQAPLHGSVTISPNGSYSYTPASDFHGTDIFTVAATDTGSHLNLLDPGRQASTEANVWVQQGPATDQLRFKFNYGTGAQYWSPEAKTALEWAAGALSTYFVVTSPVTIDYTVTGGYAPYRNTGNNPDGTPNWESVCNGGFCSSTLASASSPSVDTDTPGFFQTVVQKKIISGVDANGSQADGSIKFNFGKNWAYGSSVGSNQFDFESTAMHELLHTFGFTDDFSAPGKNTDTNWKFYDQFITDSTGAKVINGSTFEWNTAYDPNLTGGNGGLYFAGANAVAAYGGPVPLYTPKPYTSASSVAHLDDNTFNNTDPNSENAKKMMNAKDGEGLGVRVVSAVESGILTDLGYTMVLGGGGASDTGMYGDPVKNAQYWEAQSHGNNCVLMSTAMVIGQLTGKMPTENEIITEAMNTDSVVNEGKKMYLGPTSPTGVDIKDAVKLLENHGITATTTELEKTEGAKALKNLTAALSQGKSVMVGVHGATIWNAVENEPPTEGTLQADHQVVVIAVDLKNRFVYLNDSGFAEQGKNMKVPLDAFMKGWQADDFELTAAALKAQEDSMPTAPSVAA